MDRLYRQFCTEKGIELISIPSAKHSKNAIKSRHSITRSIFVKLRDASPDAANELLDLQAVSRPNDLNGN